MKKVLLFFALLFISSLTLEAQITTFPHTEDFEGASTLQSTPGSCDATVAGASITNWIQDPNDDGDWRADTAGTPSIGTGPGATLTTSGVGVGKDYNPGTTDGIYLYTEATNATSCSGSEIIIESPDFDLTATNKYYRIKFNYHMYGAAMGSLHVDLNDGSGWVNDLWTQYGEKGSDWIEAIVNLANYAGDTIKVRLRAIMGVSFTSDCAIDNFKVEEYTPPSYDAIHLGSTVSPNEYPQQPLSQFDSISFSATVKNEGVKTITKTISKVTGPGTFNTTIDFDSIQSFDTETKYSNGKFLPTSSGLTTFKFETTIAETDADLTNNSDSVSILVTDSVLAREMGNAAGGLGFNGVFGKVGQRFKLNKQDTLSTVSFYANTPTAGDSVRVLLYEFNGSIGNLVSSSKGITYANNQNWYHTYLDCTPVLDSGEYFLAIEQLTTNNMGLGYSTNYYTPNTAYYDGGGGWTTLESANFLATLIIRMNFGTIDIPTITATVTKDSICPRELVTVSASPGASSYSWTPSGPAFNPTNDKTIVDLSESTTMTVTVDMGCKLEVVDSVRITIKEKPKGTISNDTTICVGDSATISATSTASYQWIGGPKNTDWVVKPLSNNIYTVEYTGSNGCSITKQVAIDVSKGDISTAGDTAVCPGEQVTISAYGSTSYQWKDGPTTPNYDIVVNDSTIYYVTGYNEYGCIANDSVIVTTLSSPNIKPLRDTGACFTQFITIDAGGSAENYEWSTGSDSSKTTLQIFTQQTLTLKAYNANGCTSYDTVFVDRYIPPKGSTSNDTIMCFGDLIPLTAYGGSLYIWSTGDTAQIINVSPEVETIYEVTVISAEGCKDYEDVKVSVDPLAVPAFKVKTYKDSVVFTNQSGLSDSYLWQFGDGESSSDENPYHVYQKSGEYTITLTATNNCGDVDSSITISVVVPSTGNVNNLELGQVKLYPSPTRGLVNIELINNFSGRIKIIIRTAEGKLVVEEDLIKNGKMFEKQVNMADLSSGVYTIQMIMDEGSLTRKVTRK